MVLGDVRGIGPRARENVVHGLLDLLGADTVQVAGRPAAEQPHAAEAGRDARALHIIGAVVARKRRAVGGQVQPDL